MPKIGRITARDARRLIVDLQGLSAPPRQKLDPDGLVQLVERIGYVQVDSINMVERAHHMILYARNQTYRPAHLKRLVERERRLFENWTHDAAVIPTQFYPVWNLRFERDRPRLAEKYRRWQGPDFEHSLDRVLDHVAANGPAMARDLSPKDGGGSGGWWEWHPAKTALEYLWRTGRLAIARREGFQKVYDLAERVIPDHHRSAPPDHADYVDWACRGALRRLGFASAGEIARFWDLVTTEEAQDWLRDHDGEVSQVIVEGEARGCPRRLFAFADVPRLAAETPDPPARLRVLSPFDPLLRDRKRLEHLFGFDYRIEVFVPAEKRQYGYYVFPLLEGDRLVGRIDMKADRAAGELVVTALWPEPRVRFSKARMARLESELDRQRRLAGVDAVRFEDGFLRDPG